MLLSSKRFHAFIAFACFATIAPAFAQCQRPASNGPDLTFPTVLYGAAGGAAAVAITTTGGAVVGNAGRHQTGAAVHAGHRT